MYLRLRELCHNGTNVPKSQRVPRFKKAQKKRLMKAASRCALCGNGAVGGSRHAAVLELHHILPRCKGGTNDDDNLIVVCRHCHVAIHKP